MSSFLHDYDKWALVKNVGKFMIVTFLLSVVLFSLTILIDFIF